ncbi:hypothetical protein TKWG_12080 [Advenella kashmirensis WT001]|uniref:Uncharacterized protein n=1 Tax=Advenella kashmirensis (strain DSM 17095 / LMG 22695 / WT001) TaxID=1036672 RepID=I3UC56_ADVKW|nr:hypothetical protein TKWG_12080 [Advenella kashmirensis WT001]
MRPQKVQRMREPSSAAFYCCGFALPSLLFDVIPVDEARRCNTHRTRAAHSQSNIRHPADNARLMHKSCRSTALHPI